MAWSEVLARQSYELDFVGEIKSFCRKRVHLSFFIKLQASFFEVLE